METTAPALSSEGPVLESPLPIGDDQFRRVDVNMSLAEYGEGNVLVEWRTLNHQEAAGHEGNGRTRQAAKLVKLFRELRGQPTAYPVLECIGFVDKRHHKPPRLGIAFRLPEVSGNVPGRPQSLHNYLSSEGFFLL